MVSFGPEKEHSAVLSSDGSMNNTTDCNVAGFLIFSDIDVQSKHIVDRRNNQQKNRNALKHKQLSLTC